MAHHPEEDRYYPRDAAHEATPSGDLHDPHAPGEHAEGLHVHVTPISLLATILGLLLLLTFVTVAVTWVDLGALNIWVALFIAAIKGALVVLYFMHLRWDSTFNSLIFVASLIFLVLFIGITLMDTFQYSNTFEPPGGMQVSASPDVQTP